MTRQRTRLGANAVCAGAAGGVLIARHTQNDSLAVARIENTVLIDGRDLTSVETVSDFDLGVAATLHPHQRAD